MGTRKILVVDDSADNRAIYGILLEYLGYAVLHAGNGCEALVQAREHQPDVILMDLAMPIMDGLEATKRLRRDAATADIPIVALTAHDTNEIRDAALESGCNGFLSKPARPGMILGEIERLISNDEEGAGEELSERRGFAGDLIRDPEGRSASS